MAVDNRAEGPVPCGAGKAKAPPAPSLYLLFLSSRVREDEGLRLNLNNLTGQEELQRQSELKLAEQAREQEAARQQQNDKHDIVLPAEEVVKLRPEELNPAKPEPLIPDSGVLASVRDSERPDGREMQLADNVRKENALPDKSLNEESRASRVVADLARAEQDMVRQTGDSGRGRMPEIEEQTLTRTIQKER